MNTDQGSTFERTNVEWIILADHVEILNNKLYLMGGGWESVTVNALPTEHAFAVAVSFSVPWSETNQAHDIAIDVTDQNGATKAALSGIVEAGRPGGALHGHAQRVQMGANVDLQLTSFGIYTISVSVDHEESAHTTFKVLQASELAAPPSRQERKAS